MRRVQRNRPTSRADQAPAILQITIERIQPGGEARYGELEERMVETCKRLDCPNSYLALESVTAPKEVWWFVEYATDAEVQRVKEAYEQNQPLLSALADLAALKQGITDKPLEHMTKRRVELSVGASWRIGSEPYVVIATEAGAPAVFSKAQSTRCLRWPRLRHLARLTPSQRNSVRARVSFACDRRGVVPGSFGSRRTRSFGKRARAAFASRQIMNALSAVAPAWQVSQWLNTPAPLTLDALRGRVVVLHTFQMLCPGCVSHGVPQAIRIHHAFPKEEVAVIGLHTVFEHHDVMGEQALKVFMHEYRVPFPVGIDQASSTGPVPLTMEAYGLRGTPSLVLYDRQGRVRLSHFGQVDDLQLGAAIGQLIAEPLTEP